MLLSKWVILLIQHIKQRSILYDNNHPLRKNYSSKEKIWREIAKKLNINVNTIKSKWKGLRDMYIKYLKSKTSDEMSQKKYKSYKRWPWAKYMEFLRPHVAADAVTGEDIHCDDTENTIEVLDDIKVEEDNSNGALYPGVLVLAKLEELTQEQSDWKDQCHVEDVHDNSRDNGALSSNRFEDECFIGENDNNKKQKQHSSNSSDNVEYVVEERQNNLKRKKRKPHTSDYAQEEHFFTEVMYANKRGGQRNRLTSHNAVDMDNEVQLDALEHLFLSFAKTIKKLPIKNQICTKIKIAKLIMEEELKCLE